VSHRRARPCRRAAAAIGAQARERAAAAVGARASTAAAAANVQASRCSSLTGRTAALGLTMATRTTRDRADVWIQTSSDEYETQTGFKDRNDILSEFGDQDNTTAQVRGSAMNFTLYFDPVHLGLISQN
jgi:hypothetical protein